MAIKGYIGVGNKSRLITDMEIGVDDTARRIIRGYIGDANGKAKRCYRAWVTEPDLPFDFYQGAAVVYNNRIHILGGEREPRKHYSWDGTSWRAESTLPYDFILGSAIVFDGEIHIFGSTSTMHAHYSWDGEWHQRANTPHSFYLNSLAVLYEGQVRLCGSGYGSYSQWGYIDTLGTDGDSWSSLWRGTNNSYPIAVKYDRKIHMFPASGNGSGHLTWDGSSFGSDIATPYYFGGGYGLAYNGKIHVIGAASGTGRMHYTFDGDTWERIATYPKRIFYCPAVVYKDKIHMFGGTNAEDYRRHYSWEEDFPEIYSTEFPRANVSGSKVITVNNGSRSPVTKVYNGDAVCFAVKNGMGTWYDGDWIITVSIGLSAQAAEIAAPGTGRNTSPHTINGTTYYISVEGTNATLGGGTEVSSPIRIPILQDLFIVNPNTTPDDAKVAELIELFGIKIRR